MNINRNINRDNSRDSARDHARSLATAARHVGKALFDPLEPRQLMAADLMIENAHVTSGETNPAVAGGSITVEFTVVNRGSSAAGQFSVSAVDSDTAQPSGNEEILTTRTWASLPSGQSITTTLTVTAYYNQAIDGDDKAAFVAILADTWNNVAESNESNNSGRGVGIDSIVYRAEGDVQAYTGIDPKALPASGVVTGAIGDELVGAKDIDSYSIDCAAGKFYEADVDTNSINGFDAAIRIYDRNMNLVASNDDGGYAPRTSDPYVQWSVPQAGRYFVVVSSKQNQNANPGLLTGRVDGGTGQYAMIVQPLVQPTVSLKTSGTVTEGGTPATVTVTRAYGDNSRELFVKWETYGTAGLTTDLSGLPADGVTIPAGQSSVTLNVTPIADGVAEPLEYLVINLLNDPRYIRDAASSNAGLYIKDDPRTDAPDALSGDFAFNGSDGTWFSINFDQPVNDFSLADVDVFNKTGNYYAGGLSTYKVGDGSTWVVNFRNLNSHTLADGNYHLTLKANSVHNSAGVGNPQASWDFHVLAGDANYDGKVNFSDLVILAQNYGKTGQSFSQGNFNYDAQGKVDFSDLVVLAQRYNMNLTTAALAADSTTAPTATTNKRDSRASRRFSDDSVIA